MVELALCNHFPTIRVLVLWVGQDIIVKKLITVLMILVGLMVFANPLATLLDVSVMMASMDLIVNWMLMNAKQTLVTIMVNVSIVMDLTSVFVNKATQENIVRASITPAVPILVKTVVFVKKSTATTTNVRVE